MLKQLIEDEEAQMIARFKAARPQVNRDAM
jgi:hypothetical protein